MMRKCSFSPGLLLAALAAVWLLAGCAALEWEPVTEKAAELRWPPPPQTAKAVYLGEIHRFRQTGVSLVSLITGRSIAGGIERPVAIAVEKDGRIAIADAERQGIHYYIPAEKKYLFIRETPAGELQSPVGVAFDGLYNLYATDSLLGKVIIFGPDGKAKGMIDRAGEEPFVRPTGISFQKPGGRLQVVDTARHLVHVFNVENGQIGPHYSRTLGGRGTGAGSFNFPSHIAADYRGRVLVNDSLNFRVQLFENCQPVGSFGKHGNGSGDFAMPKGLAADRWDTYYVADSLFDAVQLFDQNGRFLLTIGFQGTGAGEFWMPSGLFIDHQDRLYVCDTYNKRIQIFQLLPNPS